MVTQEALMLVTAEEQTMLGDATTIYGTNKAVQFWSIAICIMEIAIALFTVFFIRRLFVVNDKKIRPS
jgi:hypothetical protein